MAFGIAIASLLVLAIYFRILRSGSDPFQSRRERYRLRRQRAPRRPIDPTFQFDPPPDAPPDDTPSRPG
jgi:hypothetical protein